MDVCDLLRDSQYINENITDKEINHIVSGALDRLHYEKDPCVKYNPHEKLWVYIHKNRDLDYKGWKDDLIFEENKNNVNNDNDDSEKNNEKGNLNKIKKRISSYLEKNLDNHLGNKRKREKHKHSHSHSHNKNKESKHKHHLHNSKNNSNNSSKNVIKLND